MLRRIFCVLFCAIMYSFTWLVTSATCQNWTIGTEGKTRWFYGQYTQMGSNGFFGSYDIDNSATGDFASLNGWMGVQNVDAPNILVSGANSNGTTLSLELNPTATFNWASVTGRYRIIPYDTATAPGSEVPVSPGQWTHWNVGVTMPVGGSVFVGKKYFFRACGLQFSQNRTSEYILFETYEQQMPDFLTRWFPFLTKQPAIKPIRAPIKKFCRKQTFCPANADLDCDGNLYIPYVDERDIDACISNETCVGVDPCADCPAGTLPVKKKVIAEDGTLKTLPISRPVPLPICNDEWHDYANWKFGFGVIPWQTDRLSADPNFTVTSFPFPWNAYDVNLAPRVNLLAYFQWYNDVIDFGFGTLYSAAHVGPELAQSSVIRAAFPPTDRYTSEGWVYLKYFNGPFMLRTEFDWFARETRFQRSASGFFLQLPPPLGPPLPVPGSGSQFAPQFIDAVRFMVEGNVQLGPAVLSLFYSHMPGPDRRHGIYIKKQPFIRQSEQTGLDPFYHFSSLLAYRYGSGVNSFGDLADASAIGGKIDYALAANLSLSASFLHATRVSHGYGWGFIRPALAVSNFGRVQYLDTNAAVQAATGVDPYDAQIPAIPASDVGWEAVFGLQWQLLNQFIVELNVSYWRPGKWFNYACVDKGVVGWNAPSAANNWGVNPNRTIDPVVGIELALLSSF